MDVTQRGEHEQMRLWNGPAGRAWVEAQDILDEMFRQFEEPLQEIIPAGSARRVLDVGCGTGGLTVSVARKLGECGRVVGIDISAPMIATAMIRECDGASVRFVCADAQRHEFEPASFDTIVSRLGVMFFEDPVAAFMNLRRAATEGAELRFTAWRSAAENPFMTTAERAAAPLLPDLPVRRPDGPGQFAFADGNRVRSILHGGGWIDIDIQPLDIPCSFRASELRRYITWLGPVGTILQNADEALREKVIDAVRPGFDGYVRGSLICFTAACWWSMQGHAPATPVETPLAEVMHFMVGAALIGSGATALIDVWGIVRARLFGIPTLDYGMVGRWFAHLARGRLYHSRIAASEPAHHERLIGWAAHYLIGIVFAAILLVAGGPDWLRSPTIGAALTVGIGSSAAPFLIMQPGMGLGLAASRSPRPNATRLNTVLTHAIFGLGLYAAGCVVRLAL